MPALRSVMCSTCLMPAPVLYAEAVSTAVAIVARRAPGFKVATAGQHPLPAGHMSSALGICKQSTLQRMRFLPTLLMADNPWLPAPAQSLPACWVSAT